MLTRNATIQEYLQVHEGNWKNLQNYLKNLKPTYMRLLGCHGNVR